MVKVLLQTVLQDKKSFDRKTHNITHKVLESTLGFYMHMLSKYCTQHPTCDACCFRQEHIGCYFRNKTPREWGNKNE